jgi:hypothetical protein
VAAELRRIGAADALGVGDDGISVMPVTKSERMRILWRWRKKETVKPRKKKLRKERRDKSGMEEGEIGEDAAATGWQDHEAWQDNSIAKVRLVKRGCPEGCVRRFL